MAPNISGIRKGIERLHRLDPSPQRRRILESGKELKEEDELEGSATDIMFIDTGIRKGIERTSNVVARRRNPNLTGIRKGIERGKSDSAQNRLSTPLESGKELKDSDSHPHTAYTSPIWNPERN